MAGVLSDLVRQVKLFCNLEIAMADMLEDHEKRLAAAEKAIGDNKKLHDGLHTRVIQNENILGSHIRGLTVDPPIAPDPEGDKHEKKGSGRNV